MVFVRGTTSIVFAENQLSPSLIGLSPLATGHPLLFQQEWVRSSSACYRTFNLPMARSTGFGSHPGNSSALFRLAFAAPPVLRDLRLAPYVNSQTHYAKGTPSPHEGAPTACKQQVSGTFHSPNRGAFHLSLAVLFTIGRHRVFSLTQWSAFFSHRVSRVRCYSGYL